LSDVVRALHSPSGFSSGLHSGQKKPDQNTDDGDHNQEFN
jgi:hypothetical protein